MQIYPDSFHVNTPNIVSSIVSPNCREHIYLVENYIRTIIITFVYISEV
jgi:hypothetical protein